MRILINFSPIKKGGGQNVALNFIKSLFEDKNIQNKDDYIFLTVKNSPIHLLLEKYKPTQVIFSPSNPMKRIIYETFYLNSFLKKNKVDLIYSYFGFANISKKFIQITGSVDSNIYYPDIKFWKEYSIIIRLKKIYIDFYRIYGLKKCTGIIFENPELERRYKLLYNSSKPTTTIYPSVSQAYTNENYELPTNNQHCFTGLFLCGWHLNKNIMIIPILAKEFMNNKIPFRFILTAPEDNSLFHKKFLKLAAYYNVQDMISIVGNVKKEQLCSLYKQIDFVFLLSKLESFSNNIIESYFYKKPIVVSNEPWARMLCKDAAIYVDRDNPEDIFNSVIKIINDKHLFEELIAKGDENLKEYPSINEKTKQEIDFIKYVHEKYS